MQQQWVVKHNIDLNRISETREVIVTDNVCEGVMVKGKANMVMEDVMSDKLAMQLQSSEGQASQT